MTQTIYAEEEDCDLQAESIWWDLSVDDIYRFDKNWKWEEDKFEQQLNEVSVSFVPVDCRLLLAKMWNVIIIYGRLSQPTESILKCGWLTFHVNFNSATFWDP